MPKLTGLFAMAKKDLKDRRWKKVEISKKKEKDKNELSRDRKE